MLRFGRHARLQHVIIESFPPRGTKPSPIWNLREIEPDGTQREKLRRLMSCIGVNEIDFLRWRNACVAPDIKTAIDYLRNAESSTPLWVTSHLLRRKVNSPEDASLAAHLALLAVPSTGRLASAHETPLLLAFEYISSRNLVYALPAVVSRILALPSRHHEHIIFRLTSSSPSNSPLVTAAIQTVIEDAIKNLIILPRDLWLRVWQWWTRKHSTRTNFSTWFETSMREQGIILPHSHNSFIGKAYTVGATYMRPITGLCPCPRLAALTAAAHSKNVSARLLLGTAHSLVHGFFPEKRRSHKPPDTAFVTVLTEGLVQRKAYSRAQAVWEDAERRIVSHVEESAHPPAIGHRSSTDVLRLTPALLEAGLSAYIMAGNFRRALAIIDRYARPQYQTPAVPVDSSEASPDPRRPPLIRPSALSSLILHLPPHAQHLVITHAAQRWGVQPDSLALEAVMQSAVRAFQNNNKNREWGQEASLGDNLRELRDGLRRLLGGITPKPSSSGFKAQRSPRSTSGYCLGPRNSDIRASSNPVDPSDDWSWYELQLDIALNSPLHTQDKVLIRQHAIDLFRSVVLGNWPFIAGSGERTSIIPGENNSGSLLEPDTMALFVPAPLRRRILFGASETNPSIRRTPVALSKFMPTPLHPSPYPRFPNAHPTRPAWTAYLELLSPEDIPEALGWMRAADEFMSSNVAAANRTVTQGYANLDGLDVVNSFRPERGALTDAIVRWEGAVLAGETPVGRAWGARTSRTQLLDSTYEGQLDKNMEEIGREGALRAWLVDWLGSELVPSREEVAHARVEMMSRM